MCGAAGAGGWDASACRGVLLCAPARPVGYSAARLSLRRCTCPPGPYTTLRDTTLRGSRRRLWRAGAPILPGGGRGSSRVLIALLLAALVAAILLAAPRKAEADHVIWSATLTAGQVQATPSWIGCADGTAHSCSSSNVLSDNTFVIAGTTYTFTAIAYVTGSGITPYIRIALAPGSSVAALLTHDLIVGSTKVQLSTCANSLPDPFPYQYGCAGSGVSLTAGSSVSLSLENPAVTHGVDPEQEEQARAEQERERQRDLRKSARRGGGCGAPEDGKSPDSDEAGYWHCHGDSVYHRHAGTWRGSHQPGGDRPQPPGLRPEPRPPNQQERDRGFADNWNGGWHWHGDDIYHIHRSPH